MLKSSMSSTRTEKTDSLNSSGMYHKYQHDISMSPEELKWETVF